MSEGPPSGLSAPAGCGIVRRMGSAAPRTYVDYPAYLAIERETDRKHEWYDGQVYAMAGGTLAHSQLSARMTTELSRLADARGCRVFNSDGKLRVLATGRATWPDASVVCGPVARDPEDPDAMTNPVVIVEVLSDATERDDRGEKFHHYRRIASLRHYVLVSQHEARVEVLTRVEGGRWELAVAEAGETFALDALGGAVAVDAVYRSVELTPRE